MKCLKNLPYKLVFAAVIVALADIPAFSEQAPVEQISGTQASVGSLKAATNTRLSIIQSNFVELYSLITSGLPPCNNAGDIREWDGDSWECTPVLDFSATSPLNFNSTTGVLSLTPWASQSAFEAAMGWTISGSGGGITVSSTLPTTAGSATLNDSTHVLTVASDTGYTQFTGSFTAWDQEPNAFGFGNIPDAVAGQEYCWTTPVTVAGINRATTVLSTADSYKINGTTSTATSISLGDTFTPCMTASLTAGATISGNMTVGGVAGSPAFSVTTAEACDSGIVINGCFSGNSTDNWIRLYGATLTTADGVATLTNTLTAYGQADADTSESIVSGTTYHYSYVVPPGNSVACRLFIGDVSAVYTTTPGTYTGVVVASTTSKPSVRIVSAVNGATCSFGTPLKVWTE
jgi:hypothetical protein